MNLVGSGRLDLGSVTVPGATFEIGAVYVRKQVHRMLGGGGEQSGISRVANSPVTLIFSGLSGRQHGYLDSWDEDDNLHYSGQGQLGDMQMKSGNVAIAQHQREGRRLLVFQMLGGGLVRFSGEFRLLNYYWTTAPDRALNMRKAIMFVLQPVVDRPNPDYGDLYPGMPVAPVAESIGSTSQLQLKEVRKKQNVFRHRLTTLEAGCRLTAVADLRFLRASHIKPWAVSDDSERVCRDNGLLLTPSADLLFDRGWISFRDSGGLLVADSLPGTVKDRIGLDLRPDRNCGNFSVAQQRFLEYHRDCIFEQGSGSGPIVSF